MNRLTQDFGEHHRRALDLWCARWLVGLVTLLVLFLLAGCRPHPQPNPQPGDSTVVTPPDTTADTAATEDPTPDDTTSEMTPADTLIGTRAGFRGAFGAAGGLAFGLSQWPSTFWSTGPFTAVMASTTPELLGGTLRAASRVGMRFMVVAPRRLMTANGETQGRYVPDREKQLCDDYTRKFPSDSLQKYVANGTLIGFSLGDDFSSAEAWGGTPVTPATFAPVLAYCRGKFPAAVPVGARQTPAWISGSSALAQTIDFGWAQYLTKRGTPTDFYGKAAAIATRWGFKVVKGVNIHSCHAAGEDDPCSASELRQFLGVALDDPTTCASLSWRYDDRDYNADRRAAFADLAQQALGEPARDCHRLGS